MAMRGRKPALTVKLSEAVRQRLEGWLRATSTPLGKARRARALLLFCCWHCCRNPSDLFQTPKSPLSRGEAQL